MFFFNQSCCGIERITRSWHLPIDGCASRLRYRIFLNDIIASSKSTTNYADILPEIKCPIDKESPTNYVTLYGVKCPTDNKLTTNYVDISYGVKCPTD